ncbi:staphyloferrin B biosynthesis protein SbnC [Staphylococcus intermedius]|uniref:Siderophore biosynthesis protein, IucC family n=1 Tax=Staphylococcus intermedius NCTC 11048 TaxID=1141106 RepID=A0A380GBF3_STAIN|nr:staphyloferrin B biosynthesis protein SbnC [Staphylococcus intermedius]PCF65564.1 siderophore biosynthesis protein SbnC [Staphylococcus intermedius]PCF81243.1 siderophore biosynthesis protein SbnC [Staphylococcus intermedius]PCF82526.1 siderophore biosynthesis protein SbnC [Staphylococcus intermedius]PCF87225.1 siderophore biosynthesis protein SbnC [Staphylococcus intermedius]PNZ54105.1 siderophore biosynthesis protein SbnC [Staphylococcus intermedius NCTC 11048]
MVSEHEHNVTRAQQYILQDLVDALLLEDLGGIASTSHRLTIQQQEYLRYEKKGIALLIPVYFSSLNVYRFSGEAVYHIESKTCMPLTVRELWDLFVTMNADLATEWAHERFAEGVETAVTQLTAQFDGFKASEQPFIFSEQLASLKDRPFHPVAKEKRGLTAEDYTLYQAEYHQPLAVKTVAIKKSHLIQGKGVTDAHYTQFWGHTLTRCQQALVEKGYDATDYIIFPVHPWQYEHVVLTQFSSEIQQGIVVMLDVTMGQYLSSSSMRTLIPLDTPFTHLKVPFSMQSLGALRLTPTRYMKNGEAGEALLRHIITQDASLHGRVALCDETVWWSYMNEAQDIFQDQSGHLTMQLRHYPQSVEEADWVVSMAALATHEPTLYEQILGTADPTNEQITALFAKISDAFLMMTLSMMKYGVLPELHGQNVLIAFREGQVSEFILRDHDTVRIFPKWLTAQGFELPKYAVRKDTPNTLLNEDIETFFAYFQTLAVSVNLYAIVDALVDVFKVSEIELMTQLRQTMKRHIRTIDWLPGTSEAVEHIIFNHETWPFKRILLPLLHQRGDGGGSMPSSIGRVPNPMKWADDYSTDLAT